QEESWNKLDEIIRSRVEVRSSKTDMPLRTQVSLQTIIQQWDTSQQTPVLQQKVQELGLLRLNVAKDYVALVEDYRQVLETYLQKQSAHGAVLLKRTPSKVAEETARQLDALDAQRDALRSPSLTPPVATTGSGQSP